MPDIFREVRERVSAENAARYYGLGVNRAGFTPCIFHREKTASLKLYNGSKGFYCFGCNRGGSVIDLVAQLCGLDALGAVRKLDMDFRLGLSLDRKQTSQEHTEAARTATKRREITEAHKAFEVWRTGFIDQLNAVYRIAHLAILGIESPKDMDNLTVRGADYCDTV